MVLGCGNIQHARVHTHVAARKGKGVGLLGFKHPDLPGYLGQEYRDTLNLNSSPKTRAWQRNAVKAIRYIEAVQEARLYKKRNPVKKQEQNDINLTKIEGFLAQAERDGQHQDISVLDHPTDPDAIILQHQKISSIGTVTSRDNYFHDMNNVFLDVDRRASTLLHLLKEYKEKDCDSKNKEASI